MSKHVVLNGFMATGKSTIGPIVAAKLGLPFVDQDEAVERRAGKSVAAIFDEDGVERFRALEADVLVETLRGPASVIATGGGALEYPENRTVAESQAQVITLTCSLSEIVRRMEADGPELRPFVRRARDAGLETRAAMRRLLDSRTSIYDLYPSVSTEDNEPEDAAAEIEAIIRRLAWIPEGSAYELRFPGMRPTSIEFGPAGVTAAWEGCADRVALVSESNVLGCHGTAMTETVRRAGKTVEVIPVPAGEPSKSLDTLRDIYSRLLDAGIDRDSELIAFGGGMIGDLAGFAAATYLRGISLILVPTTLLAQVDASIGGKTGVDFGGVKNAIGGFYPASRVIIDAGLLATLPELQIGQGMAEVVKVAMVRDASMLNSLEACDSARSIAGSAELTRRAIRNKLEVVAADPYERTGERALLNFGHTIGHAIESVSGYTLPHGDCVAMGMAAEARFAVSQGFCDCARVERLEALLAKMGLPVRLPAFEIDDLMTAMRRDKKVSGGTIRMIMLQDFGSAELTGVDEGDLLAFLRDRQRVAA